MAIREALHKSARATDRFRESISDLEGVRQTQVARARNSIKALVGGEINLIPMEGDNLEAEPRGDYAGLVKLANETPGGKARAGRKSYQPAMIETHGAGRRMR